MWSYSEVFFYSVYSLLIASSYLVISLQHLLFSLLCLVFSFLFTSLLLFLLECEFLALIVLVVYVGAVAVLFIFAIMMAAPKINDLPRNITKDFPAGFIFGTLLIAILGYPTKINYKLNPYILTENYLIFFQNWYDLIDSVYDVVVYGVVLYTYFVLQFLISGLILLMVLVGVVYLTNYYGADSAIFGQITFKQTSRNI